MTPAPCIAWAARTILGWIAFLALCPLDRAAALDPAKAITQYIQEQWPVEDLPQSSILAMAQSADGYIWLGTQNGLVRFDGVAYRVYDRRNTVGLSNDAVRVLLADRSGAIWIGTNDGLFRLNRGNLTHFVDADGSGPQVILALHEDRRGGIWVGTPNGLSQVAAPPGNSYAALPDAPPGAVLAIAEDADGTLWFSAKGLGLVRLDGTTLETRLVTAAIAEQQIMGLAAVGAADLWVGTLGAGLRRYVQGEMIDPPAVAGSTAQLINCLHLDAQGTLWIGTEGDGLLRLVGTSLTRYSATQGLPQENVLALLADRTGGLWIGTDGAGLARLRDGVVTTYASSEGLAHDQAGAIFQDRAGALWIGTFGGGLSRYLDGRFSVQTTQQGLASNQVSALAEAANGDLWVGTRAGLNRLTKDGWTGYTAPDGSPDLDVLALLEDRAGTLWIGSAGQGLLRLKGRRPEAFDGSNQLHSTTIRALHEDSRGDLWVGTHGDGLLRIRGDRATAFGAEQGLASGFIGAIHEDSEGALWLGTFGSGIVRLKDGRFRTIGSQDGLFDDSVYRILDDLRGNLWMCGNRGIFSVPKQELDQLADGQRKAIASVSYGTADGMKSTECNGGFQPAGWRTRDGRLWFPTIMGVAVVDPDRLRSPNDVSQVIIESYAVDHQAPQELARPSNGALRFPPGSSDLEIRYTATGLLLPAKGRFKYMLEGYDRDWIDAGTRRVAYYTNLPSGDFRFRVTTTDGNAANAPRAPAFGFRIESRFYQTTWFAALCAALFAALCWLIYWVRTKLLMARVEVLTERQRIARELHDTLAQGLAGIAMQLHAVKRAQEVAPERLGPLLERADRQFKEAAEESRRAILALRPLALERHGLVAALRELVASYPGLANPIQFELIGTPCRLSDLVELQVFRLAQEAVANAVQHANASAITLGIEFGAKTLQLRVSDNGQGMGAASAADFRGLGLSGMRKRATHLGGRIEIASAPADGTTLTMSVPRPYGFSRWRQWILRRADIP